MSRHEADEARWLVLGERLARRQDAMLEAAGDPRVAREAVVAAAVNRLRRPTRLGLAALAVAWAAALGLWFHRLPAPERFFVDGVPGVAGAPVSAGAREVRLSFVDGTRLDLAPETEAVWLEVDDRLQRLELRSGRLLADVHHRDGKAWSFVAGPYDVEVVGTRFELAWSAGTFDLRLDEGAVRIRGGELDRPRDVVAGQTLHLPSPEAAVGSPPPPPEPDVPTPALGPEPTVAGELAFVRPRARPRVQRSAEVEPDAPALADWRALAGSGRYREALGAARERGWQGELSRAGGRDLILLSDAARLSGETAASAEVLAVVRERFRGAPEAALAAFFLGRLALDGAGEPDRAARWFATYLTEAPRGRFRQEALGRRIEAEHRAGRAAAAASAAEQYLREYPDGPHGDAARRILRR